MGKERCEGRAGFGAGWAIALFLGLTLAGCGSAGEAETGYSQVEGDFDDAGADVDVVIPEAELPRDRDISDAGPEIGDTEPKLGPPYPVVLAHGFFGFEDFAGVGFVDYFYKVKDNLAKNGETNVHTPAVDPFNDSTIRGAQLAAFIEELLDETGYEKVNIIGHSQGGLDARVVAHEHPEWVASVWTFATPHHGTPVADVVLRLTPSDRFHDLLDALVRLVGRSLWEEIDGGTSLATALQQFSTPGISAFNAKYTDSPGVDYFSLTGRSRRSLALSECQSKDAPSFITDHKYTADPITPLFSVFGAYLSTTELGGSPNDGLVRVKDAKWGTFLGCVPADHLDEIGHLLGASPGLGNNWKYQSFYVDLVKLLRDKGY